jgi:tetratricopeptide (TPR) repeat protein
MNTLRGYLSYSALVLMLTLAVACGGGGGGGGSNAPAVTGPGGKQITTAGGAAISAAAHNRWKEALAAFTKYEAAGWNEGACESVSSSFEDAADAQKDFAEAIFMQGLALARCDQDEKALALYNKALRANGKFCKARVGIGIDSLKHGRDAQAEREFAQSVADDPQCTEGYVNLAIMQSRKGLTGNKDALSNLRRALAIDAQYLPAFNEMALLYLSEAEGNVKRLDLAEVVCSQAQKINANYAPIYNTWGLIDLKREKIIDASAKFQKAFQLDPKMFAAYMNFAQITIGFRGYDDAKDAFEKALKLQPKNFDALVGLGVAYRGLQQNDKAEEQYEAAKKLEPNRPEPYYNLGVLHQDFTTGAADEMKKARGYYEQFMSKAGSDKRFTVAIEDIKRRCKYGKSGKPRGSNQCLAGRMQNIELVLGALKDMEEMERLQKESEAQMKAMEAEQAAEGAKPAEGAAPAAEPPAAEKKGGGK